MFFKIGVLIAFFTEHLQWLILAIQKIEEREFNLTFFHLFATKKGSHKLG